MRSIDKSMRSVAKSMRSMRSPTSWYRSASPRRRSVHEVRHDSLICNSLVGKFISIAILTPPYMYKLF